MIAFLALACLPLKVLFLGNSHTSHNDVPGLVKACLAGLPAGRAVQVEYWPCSHLDVLDRPENHRRLARGGYSHVVLQAQKISSSHRYNYSLEEAVRLAHTAEKAGAKTLMYAEWPRKGWAETAYIESFYVKIARRSQAKVVPVGRAWDLAAKGRPDLALWMADGNHADKAGSYLAALCLAAAIGDPKLETKANPLSLSPETDRFLKHCARRAPAFRPSSSATS